MDPFVLAAALLGVASVAAVAFAFVGGSSSPGPAGASRKTQKRVAAVAGPRARIRGAAAASDPSDKRRAKLAETLKQLDDKAKQIKKRPSLDVQIQQAGLSTDVRAFWLMSAGLGLGIAALVYLQGFAPLVAAGAGFAGALGLPRWILGFLRNRRQQRFLTEFANAIDVIVRGVKSGLPLMDCLKIIGNEAPDPVGAEFRSIVEGVRVGLTLEEALKRMYDRMPLAEVNFFMIVLAIQSKAGGNLSEALGNLAGVLRERKRMKGKIRALSSEAKASAAIIGSLPVAVGVIVYMTTPDYISLLFTTRPAT